MTKLQYEDNLALLEKSEYKKSRSYQASYYKSFGKGNNKYSKNPEVPLYQIFFFRQYDADAKEYYFRVVFKVVRSIVSIPVEMSFDVDDIDIESIESDAEKFYKLVNERLENTKLM